MINCKIIIQNYLDFLSSNFNCEIFEENLKIATPYQYLDGDYIDIFVEELGGNYRFSDFGETVRKLSNVNFNFKNKHTRSLFSEILTSNSISSSQGDLSFYSSLNDSFGEKFLHLIQAIQQTENLLFTQKEMYEFDFRSEVERFLIEKNFSPTLNMQITGDSGTVWQINFFLNHKSNILIKALSSPIKNGDKDMVTRVHTAYSDIHRKYPNYKRSLILDDNNNAWEDENINLAKQVVDIPIGYWSTRNDYATQLSSNIID